MNTFIVRSKRAQFVNNSRRKIKKNVKKLML